MENWMLCYFISGFILLSVESIQQGTPALRKQESHTQQAWKQLLPLWVGEGAAALQGQAWGARCPTSQAS